MGNHGEKYRSNLRAVVSRDEGKQLGHLQGDQVAEDPEGQKVCSKSIQQTNKDLQVFQITSKRPEQRPQEEEKFVKSCLQERGGSQSWSSRLRFLLAETVRFKCALIIFWMQTGVTTPRSGLLTELLSHLKSLMLSIVAASLALDLAVLQKGQSSGVKLKRQAEGVAVSETTATELNVGRGHNRHPCIQQMREQGRK
ncbi:hypothetical protein Q9966_008321 [Columba livia]|nr:hypothetical protein Q9966_008321 [Columba livia]